MMYRFGIASSLDRRTLRITDLMLSRLEQEVLSLEQVVHSQRALLRMVQTHSRINAYRRATAS